MTSPWSGLNAATGRKNLYLDSAVNPAFKKTFKRYTQSLQSLIDDRLNETTGYFGTANNPVAGVLENAFNSRGIALTNYSTQQLSQAQDFVQTALNAAAAFPAADRA
jgi:hypothetical protein